MPVTPVVPPVEQVVAPVEQVEIRQLELNAVEEYRKQIHVSLETLLRADQRKNRSKVDVKHKGAQFKISLFFNDQGQIYEWKVTEESEFKRLDKYYLKLIKRLVDKGKFPPPPVERLTTTVVIIPIKIK